MFFRCGYINLIIIFILGTAKSVTSLFKEKTHGFKIFKKNILGLKLKL